MKQEFGCACLVAGILIEVNAIWSLAYSRFLYLTYLGKTGIPYDFSARIQYDMRWAMLGALLMVVAFELTPLRRYYSRAFTLSTGLLYVVFIIAIPLVNYVIAHALAQLYLS